MHKSGSEAVKHVSTEKAEWRKAEWRPENIAGWQRCRKRDRNLRLLRGWGGPCCPIGPESTPSSCNSPALAACGNCCARSLYHKHQHRLARLMYLQVKMGKKWRKSLSYDLNNIMRSLKQSESRDKCCQHQNTGKKSVKIHIVICGTVAVWDKNKTVVTICRTGTYWETKERPRAEKLEV